MGLSVAEPGLGVHGRVVLGVSFGVLFEGTPKLQKEGENVVYVQKCVAFYQQFSGPLFPRSSSTILSKFDIHNAALEVIFDLNQYVIRSFPFVLQT